MSGRGIYVPEETCTVGSEGIIVDRRAGRIPTEESAKV